MSGNQHKTLAKIGRAIAIESKSISAAVTEINNSMEIIRGVTVGTSAEKMVENEIKRIKQIIGG